MGHVSSLGQSQADLKRLFYALIAPSNPLLPKMHHSLEVVGENVKAHLGAHLRQIFGQETDPMEQKLARRLGVGQSVGQRWLAA